MGVNFSCQMQTISFQICFTVAIVHIFAPKIRSMKKIMGFLGSLCFLWSCSSGDKLPVYFADEPTAVFSMTNQQGKIVTQKEMEGKIYVVDFFFSTCPGICKKMTSEMAKVQEKVKDMNDVHLLSISVDPETDSIPLLREYAIRNDVKEGKWDLLRGNYEDVFALAQKTYHVSALKDAKADGGIFHDERLILVDKNGRVRGFYHVMEDEKMQQLVKDIDKLRNEKSE